MFSVKYEHTSKNMQVHTVPVSGTSVGLMILRICSIDCKSGDSPGTKRQKDCFWLKKLQSYFKHGLIKNCCSDSGQRVSTVAPSPPWQQKIFSSIIAAMGRQLKQSVKVFHNLMLNLRLPGERNQKIFSELNCTCVKPRFISTYTRRRTHRCGWWKHTHGCPWAGKSSLGIWSCRQAEGKWFPGIVSLCLHNHPGKGNLPLEGSHHIQTASIGLCTAHEYHLKQR